MLGDSAQAEAALQAVLNSDAADCEALFNLGLLYLDQGRRTDLVQLMQRLLETPRGALNSKLLAALCYLRHGNLDVARQLIDDVIANDPNLIRARMLRVEWLSRSNSPLEELIRAINDVLRVQPGLFEAQNWLRKVHQMQAAAADAARAAPAAMPAWSSPAVVMQGIPA
jgi:tetratricopeptide (TPR) repeat protein